ncbi:hypothetical protein GP475_09575 [Corynebacterium poyangense]|uniref:Uncharacterized protein n=1 Tax=Corynebacterium poyangense TaxID=2684405 RepID=A0A7H0SQN8_9CORY|nr:hypothetical protein [Corynebacterium poyangense]MBZ8178242.1 hypothetical protein [Corynebacterium poyangense]QNQ90863.1 hypothetical protein GP475_09575 [Corynebacterium poyangense]
MILNIIKLPFKVIGFLIKAVLSLITAVVLPIAAVGGAGFLGFKYLQSNPEKAEQLKNNTIEKIKGLL